MKNTDAAKRMFNATAHIERMFWIAGVDGTVLRRNMSELEDVLDAYDMDTLAGVLGIDELRTNEESIDASDIIEALMLKKKFGIIAEVLFPRKSKFVKGSCEINWDVPTSCIIYAETLDDLVLQVERLSKEKEQEDKRKRGVK